MHDQDDIASMALDPSAKCRRTPSALSTRRTGAGSVIEEYGCQSRRASADRSADCRDGSAGSMRTLRPLGPLSTLSDISPDVAQLAVSGALRGPPGRGHLDHH